MKINECKVIQDFLLPNYIENLTDEETNKYIKEHLSQCNECSQVLEDMKKDIEKNKVNTEKNQIKFIKKFKNKMLILKFIILAILLTIFLTFFIIIGRKMLIISDLSKKSKQYENQYNNFENYHAISYTYWNNHSITREDEYYFNDKIKQVLTSIPLSDEDSATYQVTYIGKIDDKLTFENNTPTFSSKTYTKDGNRKFYIKKPYITSNGYYPRRFYNLPDDNLFSIFKCALITSIKETIINNRKTYLFENMKDHCVALEYFDKESSLKTGYHFTQR